MDDDKERSYKKDDAIAWALALSLVALVFLAIVVVPQIRYGYQ